MAEELKCAACGSTNLDEGRLYSSTQELVYKSKKQRRLSLAIGTSASACLECGFVQLRVDPGELKKKRKD